MLEREIKDLHKVVNEMKASDRLDATSKLAYAQRDVGYFVERLRRAIPIDPPLDHGIVTFGHTVTVEDDAGTAYKFILVGEDEFDIDRGRINWASPITKLLTNKAVGDEVIWPRRATTLVVEVVDIS